MNWLANSIERNWQKSPIYNLWLAPLWLIFICLSSVRRSYYRRFKPKSYFSPLVVVGNISVGGTGKTPLIEYLLAQCTEQGIKAGLVARGYGGKAAHYPLRLNVDTQVSEAGDEPFMLYRNSRVACVVDPNRKRAVQQLAKEELDVIFSDDGLQHYALARDYEIVLVDGARGFGNAWRLPIGPLREPIRRLQTADLVLTQGQDFKLVASKFVHLKTGSEQSVEDFVSEHAQKPIKAMAGIGNPQRFFNSLKDVGLNPQCQALNDHHAFSDSDLKAKMLTIMTEKDAVKCFAMAGDQHWYLKVEVQLEAHIKAHIQALFTLIKKGKNNG